jgi:hypothetical protein
VIIILSHKAENVDKKDARIRLVMLYVTRGRDLLFGRR